VSERTLSVLDGGTFVLGDRLGDVRPDGGREHGFFSDDTRFVSRWVLRLNDTPLELLSLNQSAHFDAQFFLTPTVGPDEEAPCSIVRHRLVGDVWMERLIVTNHLHETTRVHLALDVDTDFADLFEVKDGVVAERDVTCYRDDAHLTLSYARGDFRRSVTVAASSPGAVTRYGFAFTLELAHGEQWSVDFAVSPHAAQPGVTFASRAPRGGLEYQQKARYAELESWLAEAPALEAADPALTRTYRTSLSDLGALRMRPDLDKHPTLPAAGLPWVHGAVRS
jgi:N-terminal domain of (some) glycogen debranching enzymes